MGSALDVRRRHPQARRVRLGVDAALVDRIVLEHHGCVEEFAQSGPPLDVGQADPLVVQKAGLLLLQAAEEPSEGLGVVQGAGTGRVLMKSPTMDSTPGSSGGRPETVAPKTTSSRPVAWARASAHAPCTTVFIVTPWLLAHRDSASLVVASTAKRTCSGVAVIPSRSRGDQGRAVQAGQRVGPRVLGGTLVARVQPAEVVAVGPDAWQAAPSAVPPPPRTAPSARAGARALKTPPSSRM